MGLEVFCLFSYEEFQFWLARGQGLLEELEELMGVELGVGGDSLDILEAFLLERYRSCDEALRLDQRGLLDAASRHVGLVMVLGVEGAKWAINLDDPNLMYASLPLIELSDGDQECPLSLLTAALDRRTGSFLREVFQAYEEDYNGAASP